MDLPNNLCDAIDGSRKDVNIIIPLKKEPIEINLDFGKIIARFPADPLNLYDPGSHLAPVLRKIARPSSSITNTTKSDEFS